MSNKLYVGNISFQTKEENLEELFGEFGKVNSVKIITDRETGRSRGFGFVEMETSEEAEEVISNLNGKEVDGRTLKINVAQDKNAGGGGGGGGRDRNNSNRRW